MELYGTADYLVDAGTYVVTYGPDQLTEHGKYLNIWTQGKRIRTVWRESQAVRAPGKCA